MSVSREVPPGPVDRFSPTRRSFQGVLVVVVLLSLALGSLVALPAGAPSASRAAASPAPSAAPLAPAPAVVSTHGDLVVPSGHTYTIKPIPSSSTYYQGGNITVQKGGTLIITGVTLSFVQFITPTGTALQRLSHIYRFVDNGTVNVTNSVITTDVIGVNVYAKLNVQVHGNMTLWNSKIEFPGWVSISGIGAALTLNGSRVQANPLVANLSESKLIKNDTDFAPTITATAGGALNLFGSNVTDLYANNYTANGVPGPAPLSANDWTIGATINNLSTPNDTANLTRDWLYPVGIAGGFLTFNYNNSGGACSTQPNITYNGVGYLQSSVAFTSLATNGMVSVPFSAPLVTAINTQGMLSYLNYTGDFGVTPSKIAIAFSAACAGVLASHVSFNLNPPVSNDVTASGSGTTVNTVDSSIALTFTNTPSSPLSSVAPLPWLSNKLVLTGGATAYLANLTVENKIANVFSTSAILPDATSSAYLYRWASFPMTGLGGLLPVVRGQVTTYCGFNSTQLNNATVTAKNNIQTADPASWNYLQYADNLRGGDPAYATSGTNGVASVLLVSNEITGPSLPGGIFMGGYHVFLAGPASTGSESFNWSVSAYPIGVAVGTPGYGMPDGGPTANFPAYSGSLAIAGIAVSANSTASTSVHEGQILNVSVTLRDAGAAPITSLVGGLFWNSSQSELLSVNQTTLDLTASGQTATVYLRWQVNDSVTGLRGTAPPFANNFSVNLRWNSGVQSEGGGIISGVTSPVTILPSAIKLFGYQAPPSSLSASTIYEISGNITYNGSRPATVEMVALGGGSTLVLGSVSAGPAKIEGHTLALMLSWDTSSLTAGTSYTLEVRAIYNSVTQNITLPGTYSTPSSKPSNVLLEKFLGEPLWIWIVIAVAIVAGALGLLTLSRRQAAGKLVECGECGNLIPEDARVCPKCGAEFEADVVRCSRCASTIPANSKFCPECAAQLLGKPGEAEADPERQAYADFTERFRAEGRKELGENYTEGAFWDWWKRQPTYTPFSQWKLQQGQGTPRTGMTAPPAGTPAEPPSSLPRSPPGRGGGGSAPPAATAGMSSTQSGAGAAAPPAASGSMKACPSCSREIPSEYLVCPFCGAVTQ